MSAQAPEVTAFIGIGSNLDNPAAKVRAALRELAVLPGSVLVRKSSLYRTSPVGFRDQPDFINAVAELRTALGAQSLLAALLEIESHHGRVRSARNAPRTLDLDLLLFGQETIDEPGLTIPHPRMHERAFVLAPLAEIAPEACIPGRGPARHLLAQTGAEGVICVGPS